MIETVPLTIIGSGPAGWAAAIYAARAKLSPVVLSGGAPGGQLMFTSTIENYPGFEHGIDGPLLMTTMRSQAASFGTRIIDAQALSLSKSEDKFVIQYSSEYIHSRGVVVATGATAITLNLPEEKRLMGRGVGTCAVCDAPFYKDKALVFVVGGGDSAMEEALALAKYARSVVIVVRKNALRASSIMSERVKSNKSISIWFNTNIVNLHGEKRFEAVTVDRGGAQERITADGLFYAIGHSPETGFLKNSGVLLDEKGFIQTGLNFGFGSIHQSNNGSHYYPTATSVPGIFAAGDCVDPRYRQAITAAGYGCMAALDAQHWLEFLPTPS